MDEGEGKAVAPVPRPAAASEPAMEAPALAPTLIDRIAADQAALAELLAVEAARLRRLREEIDSWQPAAEWLKPAAANGASKLAAQTSATASAADGRGGD